MNALLKRAIYRLNKRHDMLVTFVHRVVRMTTFLSRGDITWSAYKLAIFHNHVAVLDKSNVFLFCDQATEAMAMQFDEDEFALFMETDEPVELSVERDTPLPFPVFWTGGWVSDQQGYPKARAVLARDGHRLVFSGLEVASSDGTSSTVWGGPCHTTFAAKELVHKMLAKWLIDNHSQHERCGESIAGSALARS